MTEPLISPLVAPSLRRRLACWLYEGMLLFAVVFVAGWLFSTLGQMRNAMDDRRHLLQAFLFVVFGIYFSWFWARGQTLAMKTWKFRLIDARGGAVGMPRALLRYLLCWPSWGLFGVGLLWAIFDREHQFLHDRLAGTRLMIVSADLPRASSHPPPAKTARSA